MGYSPWGCKESDTTERLSTHTLIFGLPRWQDGKESACQCRRRRLDPRVGKIPWRRKWQPSPVFLPGKSQGQRSLAGYSSWGCKELSMTERLTFSLFFQASFMPYWQQTTGPQHSRSCKSPALGLTNPIIQESKYRLVLKKEWALHRKLEGLAQLWCRPEG